MCDAVALEVEQPQPRLVAHKGDAPQVPLVKVQPLGVHRLVAGQTRHDVLAMTVDLEDDLQGRVRVCVCV